MKTIQNSAQVAVHLSHNRQHRAAAMRARNIRRRLKINMFLSAAQRRKAHLISNSSHNINRLNRLNNSSINRHLFLPFSRIKFNRRQTQATVMTASLKSKRAKRRKNRNRRYRCGNRYCSCCSFNCSVWRQKRGNDKADGLLHRQPIICSSVIRQ